MTAQSVRPQRARRAARPRAVGRLLVGWGLAGALGLLPLTLGACGADSEPPAARVASYDAAGRRPRRPVPRTRPPNLILVLLDTLRRDAVALAEGEPGVMPSFASLASTGVAFTNVVAPASWTVPSVTSLLTGMLPHEHGCDVAVGVPTLPASVTTYAEALRRGYGYETAICTGAPWFRTKQDSILQGFAWGDVGEGFGLQGTAQVVGRWMQERDPRRPFFLVLHSFEAHDPYGAANHPYPDAVRGWDPVDREQRVKAFDVRAVREPWEMTRVFMLDRIGRRALKLAHGRFFHDSVVSYTWRYAEDPRPAMVAEIRKAYFDGAAWLDDHLGATVETLGGMGLLENTLLVVTSDHGEAFGEHGILGHGRALHDELIRVPLVMRGPAPFAQPRTVPAHAGLVDVMPTFFDWAGLEPLADRAGRSLLPALRNAAPGRPVISEETVTPHNAEPGTRRLRACVRDARWKYHLEYDITAGTMRESVFDLRTDPDEHHDRARDGRAGAIPWGADFCEAVERVRDRMWGEVASREALHDTIYGDGHPSVTVQRPANCASDAR